MNILRTLRGKSVGSELIKKILAFLLQLDTFIYYFNCFGYCCLSPRSCHFLGTRIEHAIFNCWSTSFYQTFFVKEKRFILTISANWLEELNQAFVLVAMMRVQFSQATCKKTCLESLDSLRGTTNMNSPEINKRFFSFSQLVWSLDFLWNFTEYKSKELRLFVIFFNYP